MTQKTDIENGSNDSLVEPLLPPPESQAESEILADAVPNDEPNNAGQAESEPVVLLASDPSQLSIVDHVVPLDHEALLVDETAWEHGTPQAPTCRNWWVALLFLVQLAVVVTLAVMTLIAVIKGDYDLPGVPAKEVLTFLAFFAVTVLAIMVLSGSIILLLLGPLSDMLIQVSLVISPLFFFFSATGSLLVAQPMPALFAGLMCALSVCYAVKVWHRIPFATANLAMALSAVKANKGLLVMSYVTSLLTTILSMTMILAVMQVTVFRYHWTMHCDMQEEDCHLSTEGKWILIGLLFSFFWSSQVIKNTFHTTVAGVVGTYWFAPSDAQGSWCNTALYDSLVRSTVYSFGSICLGSLLVAVVQVLQFIVRIGRQQQEQDNGHRQQTSLFYCLLQCVVDQLERLVEYINEWAFVYVGLYGYDYWTASKKVYNLFRARGWSVILNDYLIARSLSMMQVLIGILSGVLALLLGIFAYGITIHPGVILSMGVLLGITLSNVQFQVVTSAVETVVVCFAEAPSALLENHPAEMSSRIIRAWRQAYPNECGF